MEPNGYETVVRSAAEADAADIEGLMRKYLHFYGKEEPAEGAIAGLIRHLLEHPDHGLQFVAQRGGETVGFATLYFTFSTLQLKRAAILNDLFVAGHARREGVGEKLFRTCLAYIRERDFAYMQWETGPDNGTAQSLYAKMGGERSESICYTIA